MLRTQLINKDKLEEQIIRCLPHLDPKDLPKILSIFSSLKNKLRCDKYTRYQIEYSLLKFEKEVSNLVDLNSQ